MQDLRSRVAGTPGCSLAAEFKSRHKQLDAAATVASAEPWVTSLLLYPHDSVCGRAAWFSQTSMHADRRAAWQKNGGRKMFANYFSVL